MAASSSAEDSMFKYPTPARMASSSSGAVLPTPENTIAPASNPAASARRSSPTDTMSAPAPSARSTFNTPRLPLKVLRARSEEHTSELQSRVDLVCRLLLEKKKKQKEKL